MKPEYVILALEIALLNLVLVVRVINWLERRCNGR